MLKAGLVKAAVLASCLNMSNKSVCVLLSGGIESSCVLVSALKRYKAVYPVYIQKGFFWEKDEIKAVKALLKSHGTPALKPLFLLAVPLKDIYGKHWAFGQGKVPDSLSCDQEMYLPGRNLLFLSKASLFCALKRIPAIEIGVLSSNPFSDASGKFLNKFSEAASEALSFPIKIKVPLAGKSKAQVMRQFKYLPLEKTFSCVSPKKGLHCGRCNKCAERKSAFKKSGVADKTRYQR